jgi:hypothetical protein
LQPGGCLKKVRSPLQTGQVTYISRQDLMLYKIYPFCFSKKIMLQSPLKKLNIGKKNLDISIIKRIKEKRKKKKRKKNFHLVL